MANSVDPDQLPHCSIWSGSTFLSVPILLSAPLLCFGHPLERHILLGFHSKLKDWFLFDNILSGTICLLCFSALFSNIFCKNNFTIKNGSDLCNFYSKLDFKKIFCALWILNNNIVKISGNLQIYFWVKCHSERYQKQNSVNTVLCGYFLQCSWWGNSSESHIIWFNSKYSRTSMAWTALGLWKFVRDMDSSSHWGLIIAPRQDANGDNLGMSFREVFFYLCYKIVCWVYSLELPCWGNSNEYTQHTKSW